jgi:hypothetical protein
MNGFVERVGGALVTPRATMRAAATAPPGRGTADVALLIALRVGCGNLPQLLRALFRAVDVSVAAGLRSLLSIVDEALPHVLALLLGGVLMSLFDRRRRQPPAPASALDVAAYAWIPYLTVELTATLAATAVGRPFSPQARLAIGIVGLCWAAAVWAIGLAARREIGE